MILGILVFCIILFLYIHVNYHLSTSNTMEIYEVNQPSKTKLEEICRLKQPVKFSFEKIDVFDNLNLNEISREFPNQTINMRGKNIEEQPIMCTLNDVENKFNEGFFCERNEEMLKELQLLDKIKEKTKFFNPAMMYSDKYDFLAASKGYTLPLRYNIDYRNFYLVTSGSIDVKLINPDSSKDIDVSKDYLNMEFYSAFDPWDATKQRKTESLEKTLNEGDVCFIPAYWFYTFKFNDNSSMVSMKYNTYASTFVNFKEYFVHYLQKQNTIIKK